MGFFLHPSFVIDAQSGFPIGFSDIKVWNRSNEKTTKYERENKKLSTEAKESYKWIDSSIKSKEVLAQATTVIIVQDREGDIYKQFAIVPDPRTHLFIRSKADSMLAEGVKLFNKLASCEAAGTYSINLPGDKRKKQIKRTATLEVRFCPIKIQRPGSASKNLKSGIELYAVEAKEKNAKSDKTINWKILTTLPETNMEEALCIIEWYSWRWIIKEIFKILKVEGYNIKQVSWNRLTLSKSYLY
ncbi:MAG: IS4 family transposase [Lentimicrobium sp.]